MTAVPNRLREAKDGNPDDGAGRDDVAHRLHPQRVDVVAVVDRAEVDPRRDEESEEDRGGEIPPAQGPVRHRHRGQGHFHLWEKNNWWDEFCGAFRIASLVTRGTLIHRRGSENVFCIGTA